ncbi:hypothetical protein BSP239C_03607 [Brevibacterium sp. 239c]|nr:hypothetical protein BSP239C_03607 [Brevibacterium sp. 239c]
MKFFPAILADGREGVSLMFGTYRIYLSTAGAITLATGIVNALDEHKEHKHE